MILFNKNTLIKNTSPDNNYFDKVLKFKELWDSGESSFTIKTSGSTGTPKEIILRRTQLIASAKLTEKTFDLKENDIAFCCLNIEYIAGMMMLIRGFVLGLKMIVVEPNFSSSDFCKNIKELESPFFILPFRIDFFAFVPLQIQKIVDENEEDFLQFLHNAKAILLGGASANNSILEKIQNINSPIFATYGMTETVTHVAIQRLNGENRKDYFEVLEGVKIEKNEQDCLKIKTKVLSEEHYANEWIITNDIVSLIDKKSFRLIGRFDNVINSGGIKIQLEKIENIIDIELKKIQFQGRFFTYGISDEKLGQKLILVLEGNAQNSLNIATIAKNLPKFERPKSMFFIDKFIETPTGKIDKNRTVHEFILH